MLKLQVVCAIQWVFALSFTDNCQSFAGSTLDAKFRRCHCPSAGMVQIQTVDKPLVPYRPGLSRGPTTAADTPLGAKPAVSSSTKPLDNCNAIIATSLRPQLVF